MVICVMNLKGGLNFCGVFIVLGRRRRAIHNEGDEDVKMRSNLCKGILVNVHVQPHLIPTLKLPTKQDTQMRLNYLNSCVSPITN
ncbi:hypothetical protein Scep_020153 [Stephania cephalantha]|uniref:Uncharacterized protein n=1 Tax=Stephania cephalantha TaxID=152367 RepID=A0AAP0IC47_9MAGN